MLRFNVVKQYQGFSLECTARFDAGITAVFGPSGSGKTTLLNCLAGLNTPDRGLIEFDGDVLYSSCTLRNTPPERRRFGYVFQDAALFPHLNVLDNIHYGYKLTPEENRELEPSQLIKFFRLSRLLDRSVADLSGGERQRVALARALATSPRLLLLDEPLASLDLTFRGVIIRYLKRVWMELGTPIVHVSHSISEVMAFADNVLVLSDGAVTAQGLPASVLVNPSVSALDDYATLENLLEAKFQGHTADGLAVLKLGNAKVHTLGINVAEGSIITVSIRASDIILSLDSPPRMSAQNVIKGTVNEVHEHGPTVLVYVDIGVRVVVEVSPQALWSLGIKPGQHVYLIIKSSHVLVLDPNMQAGDV